ncbi:two-component sensor histidine kinase [Pusillimonas sp. TS35]|nr:two-component sensor histidine kinase [Pusillimonas sp. TS35]
MTLQRRLIIAVLVAAPLAWLLAMAGTYWRASHEIDELYDTDMLRLAQQTLAVAALLPPSTPPRPPGPAAHLPADSGEAGLGDFSVAIWRGPDALLQPNPGEIQLPRNAPSTGFLNETVDGVPWRLYYLGDDSSLIRVAVGQRIGERHELMMVYIASQILPWLLVLPVLIALMSLAVRQALKPVRDLSAQLEHRSPDDGRPLPTEKTPAELKVLVEAMNGLLARVATLINQERRLTADAAHELRTPLAALRAQWDVAQRTHDPDARRQAQASVTRGIERLDRLVSQLLTMARLDNANMTGFGSPVDWRAVAEQAVSDCLWIADRRDVDIALEWPTSGEMPLPITGDADALAIMLKNLLDNAIRYGPKHGRVRLTFSATRIFVDDEGTGVAADVLPRLGDRFLRAAGNEESGSGLGVSIARRIAQNHGLIVQFSMREAASDFGPGLRVTILRG